MDLSIALKSRKAEFLEGYPLLVTEALCPRCKSTRTSRQKRVGAVQMVMSKLGYFPWECGGCRLVFTAKNRGKVKRKRRAEGEAHLPPVG